MSNNILFVDIPGRFPLPPKSALQSLFAPEDIISVTSIAAALAITQTHSPIILITNACDYELLKKRRESVAPCFNILCTDQPMSTYSHELRGEETDLLDHIIANQNATYWAIQGIRTTVAKIKQPEEIFGISKYLAPGTKIHSHTVQGSKDRERLNTEVLQFSLQCKLGQHTAKMAFGITEELLMNTIHDAPLAAGIEYHINHERTQPVVLREHEYGQLNYGCDGRVLAISTQDPFGALKKDTLFLYLKKVLKRKDSTNLIDTKAEGAGLGFFKVLYSSHGIVANVLPGKRTEVISLIDINEQLRDFAHMTRSIHYFRATA